MKKYLFLLLITVASYSQTTVTKKLKINDNVKQNTATRVIVQDSITKELNWVPKTSVSGIPTGGSTGQVLAKSSATDYAMVWTNQAISAGYTSVLKHQVKANVAINKGQAVYAIPTQDGTNILVGLASNATESTSSKTMGLLDATVAANGFANVVTEGLLTGLNTNTATIGDPVWLGTNGNLIYGLANKPHAPNHLVFIGIVTRVSANNGEIFVKVQNGFELDELHDVDLKTTVPVNGHVLGYNGTLWVNKTIAGWLGFTPENVANKSTSTSLGTSDTLYPTQNAVKTYADAKVADAINDGTTTIAPSQNAVFDALALKQSTSAKNQINGYAGLDSTGKIQSSQLPALAISDTYVVASQAAMLALTLAETGDVAVRSDLNKTFILKGDDPSALADWQELLTPTDSVSSVFGRTGAVTASSGDYNTSQVTENTNLYYTNARARGAVSLTTTGSSGASTYSSSTGVLNVPNYTLSGLGGVPTSRTITINGTSLDLSANRSWTVSANVEPLEINTTEKTVWNNGKGNVSTNTSFGEEALNSNATGNANTVYGASALKSNTIGVYNDAIGVFAGAFDVNFSNVTNSSYSVFVGSFTKPLLDGQTNQIVIGHNATGAGSNTVTLGNTSIVKTVLRGTINTDSIPVFADNAAATAGGLLVGDQYRTSTGQLMVRF